MHCVAICVCTGEVSSYAVICHMSPASKTFGFGCAASGSANTAASRTMAAKMDLTFRSLMMFLLAEVVTETDVTLHHGLAVSLYSRSIHMSVLKKPLPHGVSHL